MERLAFGREGLAELATVRASVSKRDNLLEFRYCRKAEDFPFVGLAQQEPGQIVHMNALHDDHDRAGALIVKSRKQRIGEPLIGPRSLGLRPGVVGLERVINDDDPAASTS